MPLATHGTSGTITGIIPPLVTPLRDTDTIDRDGTARLVEHVISGGVHGVFVLGTTGEGPSLSRRLQCAFVELVCARVQGRVPVFVGITDPSFAESVQLAQTAAGAGADYAVLSTPYYFPLGQEELRAYVERVVPQCPLPVVLYNIPAMTKVAFAVETVEALAQDRRILGIKDSGGDLAYFASLLNTKTVRRDWSVLMGPEHLLVDALRLGGDGGVAGGANVCPALFVQLYEAHRIGDETRLRARKTEVDLLQGIYGVGKYGAHYINATKTALARLGICAGTVAEPFCQFSDDEIRQVSAVLEDLAQHGVITLPATACA